MSDRWSPDDRAALATIVSTIRLLIALVLLTVLLVMLLHGLNLV